MAGPRFYTTAQVETQFAFKELGRLVEMRVNRALAAGAAVALEHVRAAETRVGKPRAGGRLPGVHVPEGVHLRDSFRSIVIGGFTGVMGVSSQTIVVWSANPNAIWQELGTRRRRRAHLKKGGRDVKKGAVTVRINQTEGNEGVKALFFMRKALRRAVPEINLLIRGALAGATEFGGATSLVDTTSVHNPAKTPGVRSRPW